jgi:Gluconate 2-dehydrogenase subunit 3
MDRRQAITGIGGLMMSSFFSKEIHANCLYESYLPAILKPNQIILLNEIGETILPNTKAAPGAKAAKVGNFIDIYVANCFSLQNQEKLNLDLTKFNLTCKNRFAKNYQQISKIEKTIFLKSIDKEQKLEPNHFFTNIKSLILMAYFTSKEGMVLAQEYLPIPGAFKGEITYKKGQKAWAL